MTTNPYQTWQSARLDYAAAVQLGDASLIAETRAAMDEAEKVNAIDERLQERAYSGRLSAPSRSSRRSAYVPGTMHINGCAAAPVRHPW